MTSSDRERRGLLVLCFPLFSHLFFVFSRCSNIVVQMIASSYPSLSEIKSSLPPGVFVPSTVLSLYYALRNLCFLALLFGTALWMKDQVNHWLLFASYALIQGFHRVLGCVKSQQISK